MIREVALKPTWVVLQDPSGAYPHSWSEEVHAYLLEHFDVVDFTKLSPAGQAKAPTSAGKAESIAPTKAPAMQVEGDDEPEESPPPIMATVEDDPTGSSRAGKYKPGRPKPRRDYGKGGGGGGPV
jgi:hypothetical protein